MFCLLVILRVSFLKSLHRLIFVFFSLLQVNILFDFNTVKMSNIRISSKLISFFLFIERFYTVFSISVTLERIGQEIERLALLQPFSLYEMFFLKSDSVLITRTDYCAGPNFFKSAFRHEIFTYWIFSFRALNDCVTNSIFFEFLREIV